MKRTIGVALATLAFLLVGTAPAEAAYVTGPTYSGVRWYNNQICVEDRTPSNGLRAQVSNATWDWNVHTRVTIYYKRGVGSCNAFAHRIVVVQGNYGPTGWVGQVFYGYHWGKTVNGNSTYLFDSPVTVKLNTYYRNSLGGWDHIITHELGHALGLGHTSTCQSVMAKGACPWLTQTTRNDRNWIDGLYAQ